MNGLQANQTSGNEWEPPIQAMLHENFQEQIVPSMPRHQRSMLKDLEEQMVKFEAEHQTVIAEVLKLYVMPKDGSVTTFFNGHRTVPQMLIQAAPWLKKYFGGTTVFTLRAPVDEYGSQTLYAVIMWPGHVMNVRKALDTFDDTWWITNSGQAAGYLSFTYELV